MLFPQQLELEAYPTPVRRAHFLQNPSLGLLQQIQHKLQQIESTQQGQSNLIRRLMTHNQPAANYQMFAPVTAWQPQTAMCWIY